MKKRVLSLFLALTLCLTLLPTAAFAEGTTGGGVYVPPGSTTEGGGGRYEDTRTEIWCVSKPDSIGRGYDGTTSGNTILLGTLGFTDGTTSYTLTEGTDFTATKTFDSADVGDHTVTVVITLIGDAASKYTLKEGTERFTINGTINAVAPNLTVTLSKVTCTVGEKLLPLLSVSGAPEGAAVTYYYTQFQSIAGYSEYEDNGVIPKIDENTAISNLDEEGNNTYYVYAKTAATKNYNEGISDIVELTVSNDVASVTTSSGVTNNYISLDDALNAAQDGDTVTLLSDVDLGETYVTIGKSITFDLNGKTLSSSGEWLLYGVLLVKDATVTVKNGTVKAAGDDSCAIQAYRSGAIMTLEDVTATVTSGKSSVTVGDFGSAVIKSGDYQGLYVGKNSHVTLEGGTFRPYMDNITNKNVKSIFWKVNETTDATSCDCMELLGNGCVYVDENGNQVRTGGGFNTVVTVQQGTAIDAPVAKIGDVKYASLSKAINAVQNGGIITLLDDLDLGNGAVLQVGSPKKNFTIDLDNHTLSADGACLIMLHNGSQLTLKNGTLDGSRCTSYQGVLYISSNSGPKLTLENVTAKSGSVADLLNVQRSVPLVYVTNGTVVFDGGTYTGGVLLETDGNAVLKSGTFQKGTNDYSIKTEDSGKHLSDYLDDDSQFWDDNTPLDLSNETQTADEVTVRPCEHKWENGKCTVCQKVCDHGSADGKSMTAAVCPTCGMKAAAQVDITGSDAKYFLTFSDALVYAAKNNGCTLKLLADVTDPVSINTPFIFDLNGHNFNMLSVGARAKIRDSSTTKGTIKELKVFNMTDETVLTVADLLEEGYAFKSSLGNKWYFGVENAITNVTVQPAPIKSVTAEHPTVTVEYGKTSGVTLTATAVLATEGGTVSYQWYKIGGTDFPIQDATENTYQLPADLGAGTHTYRLTATSDGYPKSVDITVKVTPISLEGATVTVKDLTYNGQNQFPTVTVKLGETTLTKNTDFYVDATMQANAGSYTLTVNGNGNYSGKIENVEWKIEPMKIDSVMVSSDISKVYDGTATVTKTAEEWAKVLTFKTPSAYAVVDVPSGAYTISDAYFVEKSGEETIHSPDAGGKYGISFKITLKSNNYVLQTYGEDTPSTSKIITQSGGANFTIKQATVTSPGEITQLVFNDLAKTYEIDLNQVLDDILPKGGTYGNIKYGQPSVSMNTAYYTVGNASIGNGKLSLSINKAASSEQGEEIGTVAVKVETTNYQPFTLIIHVSAQDKLVPVLAEGNTVSATDITYGQKLADSTLTATGSMICPRTKKAIPGTFAWKNGTVKPGASDSYEAEWTFTPAAGYEEYAPATGTVTIKVKPAKLQDVSVLVPDTYYYTGDAQRVAVRTSGLGADDDTALTFTYSKTENGEYISEVPEFTEAGTYTVYYKAEAANHEPATGTFTVTIDPLPISLLSVSSISKTYDGTASVTLSTEMLTFFSKAARRSDIKLPILALSFSNARFTMKQADGSYVDSPEVGGGKALSFTMTLISNNYVFEGKSEGTTEVSDVFATDDTTRFTITKATAPTDIQTGTLNVVNGTKLEYTYDAKQLLPKAPKGTYGKVSYNCEFPFNLKNGYYVDDIAIKDNILTLTIDALNGGETGKIGTIPVYVTTDNYASFNLPLNLYAVNKITPVADGEITAAGITYGDALSKSTISGKMKDPNTGATVNGTFAWTDGTTKPAANDSYEAEWTFTPAAGYEKYATATGTVTIKVNKATPTFTAPTAQENLTYTGQEQALITAGSVTDYSTMQYSLTENGTYSQDIPTGTDAGAYTVWYRVIGDANHNDTAPASVAVSIGKKPLTITGVTAASKPYDGTTNADISSVTFDNVTLNRGTDYTVTANFDDASVGNGKNITATVTLMEQAAKNYALEQSSFPTTGSIIKAAAPDFTKETALTIVNGHEKTYTVTLPALPTLETPKEYGALTYEIGEIKLNDGYYTSGAKVENGELTLPIQKNDVETTGFVGTVTVVIKSANYEDITLTINVSAKNRITPTGTPTLSKNAITYGDALNTIALSGKLHDDVNNVDVDGTFAWVDGTFKPAANDSYQAGWKFTPTNQEKYAEVTGTVTIKVNKAATTGEPKYTKITTGGKTLKDAALTTEGSTLKPDDGKLEWVDAKGNVLPDDTRVEANKTYKWRFTPVDGNYTTLTGEVELHHVSSGGGSGNTTAPVITVPVSSDKETVKVDASVSNGVATVKVTDRQLEQVTADTDSVTVDVSGLQNVSSAKLPASIVEKSEQSGAELTIALPTGSVTLDAAALAAVGNGKDVTVSVQKVALTDTQRDAVGTLAQVAVVVDVNILTGTAKHSSFNGGKLTVSIPYTLKSGEDPAKLQVWFIRDDGSIENKGGSYDRKTGCFVFSTEHLSHYLLVSTASTQCFVDVPASAYYADAVAWAVKNGITGGTSATTFDPNGFCTRAQAVTFLWRAAGSPAPKSTAMPFTDVPAGSYYYDAVLWAIENGVTKGTSDTTFSPNANCSRGQIVTFLWRSQMSPDAAAANPFTDVVADAYYTSAVLWAVERNITGGTSATTFSPSANCTRAQIVTFIYRCMK